MKINDNIEITNEDNMVLMARYPDNYFDLAVVDPPYGINADREHTEGNGWVQRKSNGWDKDSPSFEYFKELSRVSKNQVIWGANHFIEKITDANSPCWLLWDKGQRNFSLADGELAYTSFKTALRIFTYTRGKMTKNKDRFHPTQKPIQLYEWIFKNYAKKDFKILDTHLGSGSIAKALDKVNKHEKLNLSLVACELDREYFEKSILNIKQETRLQVLF